MKEKNDVTIIRINPGNTVLCDLCNKDYTNSEEKGGFLFSGMAVCPACAPSVMKDVKKYKEQNFIRATAKEDETFRDFVCRVRRGEY